jgi:hypothetical protein
MTSMQILHKCIIHTFFKVLFVSYCILREISYINKFSSFSLQNRKDARYSTNQSIKFTEYLLYIAKGVSDSLVTTKVYEGLI